MTRVEAEGIAARWEDLLQRTPLPPRVGGVTGAEYELARLVQAHPVRIIETPAAKTWIWSDLHLRDPGAFESSSRPFPNLRAMEARMLEAWHNNVGADDTIVCLGDVAHPNAFDDQDLVKQLRACPGRRVLGVRPLRGARSRCLFACSRGPAPELAVRRLPRGSRFVAELERPAQLLRPFGSRL